MFSAPEFHGFEHEDLHLHNEHFADLSADAALSKKHKLSHNHLHNKNKKKQKNNIRKKNIKKRNMRHYNKIEGINQFIF
jgi:hypothetical protein